MPCSKVQMVENALRKKREEREGLKATTDEVKATGGGPQTGIIKFPPGIIELQRGNTTKGSFSVCNTLTSRRFTHWAHHHKKSPNWRTNQSEFSEWDEHQRLVQSTTRYPSLVGSQSHTVPSFPWIKTYQKCREEQSKEQQPQRVINLKAHILRSQLLKCLGP